MRCRALVERKGGSPPRAKQSPAGALFALLTVSTEPPCSSPPGRWNIKKQLLQMQPERGALVERREGSPPRAKQSPAGALFALLTVSTEPPCSSPPGRWNIKKQLLHLQQLFLVGCPVGLEPTVSRSTIWRVNRLRYGHHIYAPEGTRTPGPLLRRQLLYPPELRAHVVIPWVPLWRQLCVGTRCEKYNTIQAPFCQAKNAKIFFLFSKPAKHCFTAATCPQSPKQSQARLRPRHRGYGARRSAHGQHR